MCHGYVACACIMCMWHVLGLGWSCGAQVVSGIECGRWGGRPQLRALPLFGVGVCGVCVGLGHRVWPVVGAGHIQLKPLACFRLGWSCGAQVVSGIECGRWEGPATAQGSLSLACGVRVWLARTSGRQACSRWWAAGLRRRVAAASLQRRGVETPGDLGMWSEKGMQAVCSVQDVL